MAAITPGALRRRPCRRGGDRPLLRLLGCKAADGIVVARTTNRRSRAGTAAGAWDSVVRGRRRGRRRGRTRPEGLDERLDTLVGEGVVVPETEGRERSAHARQSRGEGAQLGVGETAAVDREGREAREPFRGKGLAQGGHARRALHLEVLECQGPQTTAWLGRRSRRRRGGSGRSQGSREGREVGRRRPERMATQVENLQLRQAAETPSVEKMRGGRQEGTKEGWGGGYCNSRAHI